MLFNDEKDYIMRMIKEIVRILFSLMLGKNYTQVELPEENRYEISGNKLEDYFRMADRGEINEAENQILEGIDYNCRDEVTAAVYFYQYLSQKDTTFLEENDYSEEEVLEGIKRLAKKAGYGEIVDISE